MSSGTNLFLIVALAVAGITVAAAAGTFAYHKFLLHTLAGKQAALAEAQSQINEDTIDEFLDLRDRLTNGKDLLANHIVLSQFFTVLEGITLQNVRFTSLSLIVAGDRTAQLEMEGTARNFNALAAQSSAFASEKRIRRAIFSDINLQEGTVSFSLTADVDPRLVIEDPAGTSASSAAIVPTASSTLPTPSTPTP